MPSGSVGGFWSSSSGLRYGTNPTWNLHVEPAATYFVKDQLGIGVRVHGLWSQTSGTTRITDRAFGMDVGVAWSAVIAERWAIIPQLWLGYVRVWSEAHAVLSTPEGLTSFGQLLTFVEVRNKLNYLRTTLSIPVLYALSDRLAIGFGPDVSYDHLFALKTSPAAALPATLSTTATSKRNRVQIGASVSVYASF